jgi:hypothetical protein
MFDENYTRVVETDDEDKDAWTRIDVIQEIQEELDKLFGAE